MRVISSVFPDAYYYFPYAKLFINNILLQFNLEYYAEF